MTARAAVHLLLQDDPILISLGASSVYAANAVDSPEDDCFIVLKWSETTKIFGTRQLVRCSVWAHDRDRDYGRISEVLQRIEDLLTGTIHLAGEDGWTLTQADWLGEGPDLYDGGYETCTRYADFNVVSRRTT